MTANARVPAVRVAGFLRGALGLGEAARLYVQALRAADVPLSTMTVEVPLPDLPGGSVERSAEFGEVAATREPDVNLICVNAPELPEFALDVGRPFFEGRRSIGVWAWEVDRVPDEWSWAYGLLDEIWVYSDYVKGIFEPAAGVPVVRVPLPVVEPPAAAAPDLGLSEAFTFLFLFDFYSTMQRKNPIGLVEAFKRAFQPGEGPQLLLKSFNGDYKPEQLAAVRAAAGDRPDIHVIDRYVTAAEKNGLMAAAGCYVSLHRAEGFGLALAEAMALGKPVIATGFSGNMDFMTSENSYLVGHRLTSVGPEGENYPEEGVWAEPDLDHAASLMREVWQDRDGASTRAARGRADVLEQLSPERVGGLARERAEAVAAGPPRSNPQPPPAFQAWHPLRHAKWKVEYDALTEARKAGGTQGLARAAALRAMRPHTYHQSELNVALLDGLRQLAEKLDRVLWDGALQGEGSAHLRRVVQAAQARPSPSHPAISFRDENGLPVLGFDREEELPDDDPYRAFEAVFRGDEAVVRRRQAGYLELVEGAEWVVDLGCGRGEFLELLRDNGIEGRGVDSDEGMVRHARAKRLQVELQDALEYLARLDDGGLPAVFAAQFVEHLPPEILPELLRLLQRKLAPGGVAILETVNPHLPSAFKAFWVDPTHHHPLFPEVLLALCRFAGFRSGRVMFPGGTGDFQVDVYGSPDYAVVVRKGGG